MKTVLITGASRGIGYAIAEKFMKADYQVLGTATAEAGLEKIRALDPTVKAFSLDQSDPASIQHFFECLQAEQLFPDVLINNAGITADNLLLRMKSAEWQTVVDTNLSGVFNLTQGLLKSMLKKRSGRIIMLSSVVASTGNAGQSNYAATKAAVIAFAKSLAQEVASRGITVNVISPGFIETDMTNKLSDKQKDALMQAIPVQRFGTVDDIAHAALFLSSDQANYITGHTLHINGGMFMA